VYRWFSLWRDTGLFETMNHALVLTDRERAGREASPSAARLDNRDLDRPMAVYVDARSFGPLQLVKAQQPHDSDLKAVNTREQPDRIQPTLLDNVQVDGNRIRMTLAPASWNVLHFRPSA
jgi:alpha-L-arabinofuranosidase